MISNGRCLLRNNNEDVRKHKIRWPKGAQRQIQPCSGAIRSFDT